MVLAWQAAKFLASKIAAMGLFDRLRRKPDAQEGRDNSLNTASQPQLRRAGLFNRSTESQEKPDNSFYLDSDSSSSLGDVDFMRRSNSIRHTFPGTADNPGIKERVEEVASNEKGLERVSQGLPGTSSGSMGMSNDPGVPKPVKKTFAKNITQDELQDRLRGAAVKGTNIPGSSSKGDIKTAGTQSSSPAIPKQPAPLTSKPGSIDPFRQMAKELG